MIWLILILVVFILMFSYILFARFYLEIDSEMGLLSMRFPYLATASISIRGGYLIIELAIAGWIRTIKLPKKRKINKKSIKAKRIKGPTKISLAKVKAVLATFKVNKWEMKVDTGNMQWNAMLFPLFLWISNATGKYFSINFLDENVLKVEMENRMAKIILAFLVK